MIKKLLFILFVVIFIHGCKNSSEPESIPRINPLIGNWILNYITDDQNNEISGPEGVDGSILEMNLNSDGTGIAHLLDIWRKRDFPATWSTNESKFTIDIEGHGELTHSFQLLYSNAKSLDDPPLVVTLVLKGSNQFAKNDGSLIFYYTKF